MHRVTRATLGTVMIGLVAVFLVAGMVGGGLLGALHPASGQTAKGSPAGSAGAATVPLAPAARTYQTTINLVFNTTLALDTAVPANFSFYANITWGAIDNTHTHAWVVVTDLYGTIAPITYTLNGTIAATDVSVFNNNGVLYENYTWFTSLDKTTLGCLAVVSCANIIPASNDWFAITAYVNESGASVGGGYVQQSVSSDTYLVSTFVSAGFITPTYGSNNGVPVMVQFYTNISWGYTSNTTTNITLAVYYATNDTLWLNLSFNGTVNATNAEEFSSVSGFNGTVGGVPYSYTTWTLLLNNTTLPCSSFSCNVTLPIQTGGYQGIPIWFDIWANESGASAGGLATATGSVDTLLDSYGWLVCWIGSTMVTAGTTELFDANGNFVSPLPYQPLPYVATGWYNASWVNPVSDPANSSYMGFIQVWDVTTDALLTNLSLNDSVNTTNAYGVSLMVAGNGTTPLGTPYVNFTWSVTLSGIAKSLGTTVPYDPLYFIVYTTANGTGFGGVNQYYNSSMFPYIEPVFVQYPTTAAVALTSPFSAYMPTPFNVNYTITVANAPINALTTTIIVNVTEAGVGVVTSTAVPVVDNQTAYTFPIDSTTLACVTSTCSELPQTEFGISVFVGVNGVSLPTNGSLASSSVAKGFFLITTLLSASLLSPAPGASVSVGNVTVSAAYLGSWVAGAVLNIYSSGGALVYTHSIIELTPGVPVTGTWFTGAAGTYNWSIALTTVYLPTLHYFNGTLAVTTHGGNVYQNSTQWSNESAISGLSGAAAGTLLLVVGLIIGMIVALVLARAVMGRPATAPPQPWESKPGAAPNTCSVCGKSFATPEELAAHGKSEHGMQ